LWLKTSIFCCHFSSFSNCSFISVAKSCSSSVFCLPLPHDCAGSLDERRLCMCDCVYTFSWVRFVWKFRVGRWRAIICSASTLLLICVWTRRSRRGFVLCVIAAVTTANSSWTGALSRRGSKGFGYGDRGGWTLVRKLSSLPEFYGTFHWKLCILVHFTRFLSFRYLLQWHGQNLAGLCCEWGPRGRGRWMRLWGWSPRLLGLAGAITHRSLIDPPQHWVITIIISSTVWPGGIVIRTLDLWLQWSFVWFLSVLYSVNDLGQVVHPHVPLSPSSIIWYRRLSVQEKEMSTLPTLLAGYGTLYLFCSNDNDILNRHHRTDHFIVCQVIPMFFRIAYNQSQTSSVIFIKVRNLLSYRWLMLLTLVILSVL